MKLLVIALLTGSMLAGCSASTARRDGGYASPSDQERLSPVRTTGTGRDPGKEQSVQDFAQPFRFAR
jgi:hypothetical protein